jgi:hypothetical protein
MKTVGSGTLVTALVTKEGVYLAADSRRTSGFDDANKLFQLGPHAIGAIRGSAMLDDAEDPANSRMFARHFFNFLKEPLPTTKNSARATKNQRYLAKYGLKGQIEEALADSLVRIEQDWNDDELTPEELERVKTTTQKFGLTIAQSEPDGWLLLVDLTCQMLWTNGRISAKFEDGNTEVLYDGPYEKMRFDSFPGPDCVAICPVRQTPCESAETMIDNCFHVTIEQSAGCARDVGGPIDIAVTASGVVRVVRHKHQTLPYFNP